MKRHVVLYSGGIGSWCAAKRVVDSLGASEVLLLFADTKIEDEDTYRFLREGAKALGAELVEIADGRTPWEVFRDVRMLGNSRVDPCSRILKRGLADKWLKDNGSPETTVSYVGIDWSEEHRFIRMRDRRLPWIVKAPMTEAPYLSKHQMHAEAAAAGLRKQRLYEMGAGHANCGGGCVKMGIGGFARLWKMFPERFMKWENEEQKLRDMLGDVAMLKDRRSGHTIPLPLSVLRKRLEAGGTCDLFEIGGCGCMIDDEEAVDSAAIREGREP